MLLVFPLGLVLPSNLQRMHVHGVGGAFCEPQPDHPPALAGEFVVSELLLLGAPVPQCHGGFFAHCLRLPGMSKCPALGCFFAWGRQRPPNARSEPLKSLAAAQAVPALPVVRKRQSPGSANRQLSIHPRPLSVAHLGASTRHWAAFPRSTTQHQTRLNSP